jgi:hypothetical protein
MPQDHIPAPKPGVPVLSEEKVEEATMNRRETNIKRVEYVLTPDELGHTHADVTKAIQVAANEYWQATGVAQGGPLPDDAIRLNVDASSGDVIVSFELERRS